MNQHINAPIYRGPTRQKAERTNKSQIMATRSHEFRPDLTAFARPITGGRISESGHPPLEITAAPAHSITWKTCSWHSHRMIGCTANDILLFRRYLRSVMYWWCNCCCLKLYCHLLVPQSWFGPSMNLARLVLGPGVLPQSVSCPSCIILLPSCSFPHAQECYCSKLAVPKTRHPRRPILYSRTKQTVLIFRTVYSWTRGTNRTRHLSQTRFLISRL